MFILFSIRKYEDPGQCLMGRGEGGVCPVPYLPQAASEITHEFYTLCVLFLNDNLVKLLSGGNHRNRFHWVMLSFTNSWHQCYIPYQSCISYTILICFIFRVNKGLYGHHLERGECFSSMEESLECDISMTQENGVLLFPRQLWHRTFMIHKTSIFYH